MEERKSVNPEVTNEVNGLLPLSSSKSLLDIKKIEEELVSLNQELETLEEEEIQLKRAEEEQNSKHKIDFQPASVTVNDPSLTSHLRGMINNRDFTDVTLITQGEKIFCHRAMLARSPHFQKMFSINKAATEFKLNMRYDVCLALVRFLYTNEFTDLPADQMEELEVVAEIYNLPTLQKQCQSRGASATNGQSGITPEQRRMIARAKTISLFETQKLRKERKNIAREILETERTYVQSLETIQREFIEPLQKLKLLSQEYILGVFSYWEVILKCHSKLLQALEVQVQNWDLKPEIGEIFVQKTNFIKLYKNYVNNWENSLIVRKRLESRIPAFKAFIEEREAKIGGLGLSAYLILPVQRIPRYVLLLEQMIKNTVENHPDYHPLEAAVKLMKSLMDFINDNKADADEIQKLFTLQNRIYNFPKNDSELVNGIAKKHRKLLRQGACSKGRSKCQMFLLSDSLLICSIKNAGKLKFKYFIPLNTCSLTPEIILKAELFELNSPQTGKLSFKMNSDEKMGWYKAVSDQIEKCQKEMISQVVSNNLTGVIHDGTSEQFHKVIREEKLKKRSEKVLELVQVETIYISKLQLLHNSFIHPLLSQIKDGYPIVKESDISLLFSVSDKILDLHRKFLSNLQEQAKGWDSDESQLGTVFLEFFVEMQSVYSKYTDNYGGANVRLAELMNSSLHFVTFLIQKESEAKTTLAELLELPLKTVTNYYLHLEELLQYTPKDHKDYDSLGVVITRIKEYLENHKSSQQQTNSPLLAKSPSMNSLSVIDSSKRMTLSPVKNLSSSSSYGSSSSGKEEKKEKERKYSTTKERRGSLIATAKSLSSFFTSN